MGLSGNIKIRNMGRSKIIVIGRGGSGKDYMRKLFEKRGFKHCVSCTSRPARPGEIEGVDYKFVSWEYFDQNKDLFYEMDEFNGWRYGTLKEDFAACDLILMTPRGVKNLQPSDRNSSVIIYLNPPKEVIEQRLRSRNDVDSADRRMKTDSEDFFNFSDFDLEIKNPDF